MEPPWTGQNEPEYMPRLRRHFAESLDDRLSVADAALARLSDPAHVPEPGSPRPERSLHLFAHSLQGTAPGLGGSRLGDLGYELAEYTRDWETGGIPAGGLDGARRQVDEIRAAAAEYRGWVEVDGRPD